MTINDYITRELDTMRRITKEHGSLTSTVVAEGFFLTYQSKHPIDKNTDILPYFTRRADVFERYVRREWKV